MEWLSGKPIIVVADREFASPGLAECLKNGYDVEVTLRIKASMYTKSENMPETKIAKLIEMMGKGSQHVLRKQIITRESTFKMNVVLTWDEKYEESMVLATTLNVPCKANKV